MTENISKNFENIVLNILDNHGYDIQKNPEQLDAIVIVDNKSIPIEIKYFSEFKIPISILKNWSRIFHEIVSKIKTENFIDSILICPGIVDDEIIETIFQEFNIHIYDIRALLDFTIGRSELQKLLEGFIFKNIRDANLPLTGYKFKHSHLKPTKIHKVSIQAFNSKPEPYENYCSKLKKIEPGKTYAKNYEILCTEILKFLFDNDLTNWQIQKRTDSSLNIFDLIARATEKSSFFRQLTKDFNSKYIIFEFKNYSDQIDPSTVYTTERYLFKTALRNISFLISRKGPSENTMKAAKGCLKETGKLILFLNDEDLCELTSMKEKGLDYWFLLFNKLDNFLMSLDRS